MITDKDNYVEIALVYKEEEEYKIEKVFAGKIGDYYQLKAIPAFARQVAYNDIISAEYESNILFFEELIKPSGHSVLHIAILQPVVSENIFMKLISLGVNINYLHNNIYLAIDVPPHTSYIELKSYLNKEFKLGNLDYSEACLSDQHNPYE